MAKFEHLPVTIDAMRLVQHIELPAPPVKTRQGEPGDWMLTNLNGEVYFVPDAMFRLLYKPLDGEAQVMWQARMIEK